MEDPWILFLLHMEGKGSMDLPVLAKKVFVSHILFFLIQILSI